MIRNNNTAEVKGVPNVRQTNNQQHNSCSNPVDALPKQFIASMKTLFDILDDQQTGFVRYSDIEKGWQDDGCKGLPRGVLNSLKKLTPASGLLSFERFCAGLKLCLLRNQAENTNILNVSPVLHGNKSKSLRKSPRSPTTPALEIENPQPNAPWNNNGNPTATVRPRNHLVTAQKRALSLPQLSPDSSELELTEITATRVNAYGSPQPQPQPPPKPPRAAAVAATINSNKIRGACLDKSGIRHALQNWQMGLLLNEMDASDKQHHTAAAAASYYQSRSSGDGGSSSATDSATSAVTQFTKKNNSTSMTVDSSSSSSKRREPRRHTLQNGIDYNMLRRLKQYEEEREVLLLGLDAVEKARDWYLQQVENVQEKIRCLGCMGMQQMDQWSEVRQERLNFQRARVLEVNRNLATLADTWEHGCFPLHFNLAISQPNKSIATTTPAHNNSNQHSLLLLPSDQLHHQSRYMPNELHIKRLERENQALIRELEIQQRIGIVNGRLPIGFDPRMLATSPGLAPSIAKQHPPDLPRLWPWQSNIAQTCPVRQPQSSPVCSSSSGGGGLGDADVVY